MNVKLFTKAINQMRDFCFWLDRVGQAGLDLGNKHTDAICQTLHLLLTDGDTSWDYDAQENHNWIVEYTGDPNFADKYSNYSRGGKQWDLSDPAELYCFLCYMNARYK